MATPHNCGIYRLVFHDGGVYIGSTNNFTRRFRDHRRELEKGTHKNPVLQKAFDKYGGYTEERLIICEPGMLLQYEQACLDCIKPRYNLSGIAGKIEMTPEVRAKISASNIGHNKYNCPERRRKLSEASRGRAVLPETRGKISASVKARGYRHPPEVVRRIANAARGRPLSEETRRKLSEAQKGKQMSDEHKANLRAGWVKRKAAGHTPSAEARKKMSEGGKRGAQLRREALREQAKGVS